MPERITLNRYVAFLQTAVHPISGNRPVAAEMMLTLADTSPRRRAVYDMAHNLSFHGVFNRDAGLECSPVCRKQGIRLVVEGVRKYTR